MISLYQYAIRKYPNIKSISHKFLIRGHTQNEGDSAHTTIEREMNRILKGGQIFTPDQFIAAIRSAKKTGKPYKVIELTHEQFHNVKALVTPASNYEKDTANKTVKINEIKTIRVDQGKPEVVHIRTTYQNDSTREVNTQEKSRKTRFSGQAPIELQPAYHEKPGLSDPRKSNLLDLVKQGFILCLYASFYKNI